MDAEAQVTRPRHAERDGVQVGTIHDIPAEMRVFVIYDFAAEIGRVIGSAEKKQEN
jgi:hypothetical protein